MRRSTIDETNNRPTDLPTEPSSASESVRVAMFYLLYAQISCSIILIVLLALSPSFPICIHVIVCACAFVLCSLPYAWLGFWFTFWEIQLKLYQDILNTVWIGFTPYIQMHTRRVCMRGAYPFTCVSWCKRIVCMNNGAQLCWCWFIYLFRTKRSTCACERVSECAWMRKRERIWGTDKYLWMRLQASHTHESYDYTRMTCRRVWMVSVLVYLHLTLTCQCEWKVCECVSSTMWAVYKFCLHSFLSSIFALSLTFRSLLFYQQICQVEIFLWHWMSFQIDFFDKLCKLFCIILGVKLKSSF